MNSDMNDMHRVKLVRKGQQNIEPWWIQSGRPIPVASSRAEEIRNQVSFANYDLRQADLPGLAATSVEDEFTVSPVPREKFREFISIVRYHGFDLLM
jgi:hypothetical protein